jgi:hypothetical protein
MEPIVIESTGHSPKVNFNPNGQLLLEGKSLPEDVASFYDPLIDFITKLTTDKVVFDINLDYFNTATSKKLFDLLKHLDSNNKNGAVLINWHYEEGDDDSVEMAEIYEEDCLIRTQFRYIKHAESVAHTDRVQV